MKATSRTTQILGLMIGLTLAGAAFAYADGNGGVGNGNGNGNDKHGNPPAAPEPGIFLMVTAGIALGGGYILWRRRNLKINPAA